MEKTNRQRLPQRSSRKISPNPGPCKFQNTFRRPSFDNISIAYFLFVLLDASEERRLCRTQCQLRIRRAVLLGGVLPLVEQRFFHPKSTSLTSNLFQRGQLFHLSLAPSTRKQIIKHSLLKPGPTTQKGETKGLAKLL